MHFSPLKLKLSATIALFTFTVVKDTGVLPVSPMTTENGHFGGSCASIFDIFFLNSLQFREELMNIFVLEYLLMRS